MMILGDLDIKKYIQEGKIEINPLRDDTIRENGVDLRLDGEIVRFNYANEVFSPGKTEFTTKFFRREKGDSFIIGAGEHVLLTTQEYIKLPNDVVGLVNLRSSFARLGLVIPPTVVDAGFQGQLTIELVGSNFPIELTKGTRFIHLILVKTLTPVEKPYNGKYLGQVGVTLPSQGFQSV